MFKCFSNSLKKYDLFGKSLAFEEQNKENFTTMLGSLLTYIIILICIILGGILGFEIFIKENPLVINSIKRIDYSKIEIHNYPLIFIFNLGSGAEVKDVDELFDFSLLQYTIDTEDLSVTTNLYTGFKPCDANDYSIRYRDLVDNYISVTNQKLYCINHNNTYFQNPYTNSNSTFIAARFHDCGTVIKNKKCSENADLITKNFFITLITFDAYLKPKSYDNPITYYTTTFTQQVSIEMKKRVFITTEIGVVETNKGIVFDDYFEEIYYTRTNLMKDVVLGTDYFYNITFDSVLLRNRMIRSYLKIQDLLAKIGGFFNALWIISYILIRNYVVFSYYTNIYNYLREADKEIIDINTKTKVKVIDYIENYTTFNKLIDNVNNVNNYERKTNNLPNLKNHTNNWNKLDFNNISKSLKYSYNLNDYLSDDCKKNKIIRKNSCNFSNKKEISLPKINKVIKFDTGKKNYESDSRNNKNDMNITEINHCISKSNAPLFSESHDNDNDYAIRKLNNSNIRIVQDNNHLNTPNINNNKEYRNLNNIYNHKASENRNINDYKIEENKELNINTHQKDFFSDYLNSNENLSSYKRLFSIKANQINYKKNQSCKNNINTLIQDKPSNLSPLKSKYLSNKIICALPNNKQNYQEKAFSNELANKNYCYYLFNDIIGCKRKFSNKIKIIKKILSFHNIISLSYEYYNINNLIENSKDML